MNATKSIKKSAVLPKIKGSPAMASRAEEIRATLWKQLEAAHEKHVARSLGESRQKAARMRAVGKKVLARWQGITDASCWINVADESGKSLFDFGLKCMMESEGA